MLSSKPTRLGNYKSWIALARNRELVVVRLKKVVLIGLAVAMVALLTSCQAPSPKSPPESSDTDQMRSIAEESLSDKEQVDQSYYVLIVGNDSRTGTLGITSPGYEDGTGRSDTMMIARIDPVQYKVTIVTVPRDTACTYQGGVTKINEVYHQGGIEQTMVEVEKLTGIMPKYYFDLGFVTFEQFIDALGGVEANVPIDMSMTDIVSGYPIALSAGTQQLMGPEALVLARTRSLYADDLDACRQTQDRQIVEAGIRKVAADPAQAAIRAQALIENAHTNFPMDELVETVLDFSAHVDRLEVISGTGPYEGGIDDATQLWLAPRDESMWRSLIELVDKGGDPKELIPLPVINEA